MKRKFKKEDLERLNIDDLKVGDEVGILKPVMIDWFYSFRYPKIIKTKITRITPARTKIETLHGTIEGKYKELYAVNDTAREMTEIANHAEKIVNGFYNLGKCGKEKLLFNMSDDAIVRLSKKLDEVMEIIEDEYK